MGGAVPIIDLLVEEDGSLSWFAPMSLLAVTTIPDNEEKRKQFLVSVAAEMMAEGARAEEKESLEIPTSWLDLLLRSPSADKVQAAAGDYARYSWIAGEAILFLIDAAIHHPELDVTVTKALWVLPRVLGGEETWDGRTVSVAPRTVWKAWGRFKSVAHFHAVRQIWLQHRSRESGPDMEGFTALHHDKLLEYLAIAEVIRLAAVRGRVVGHEETWRPPETLQLPPAQLEFPPLPQSALDELAKYVPEHSRDAEWQEGE